MEDGLNFQPRWIEIPAMRVLAVSGIALRNDFDQVSERGEQPAEGVSAYRLVRKSDGKVFKWAEFGRVDRGGDDTVYLQEI